MTAKELATTLSGRGYGGEIYPSEKRDAQAAGLVVVYGYSDDNVELRGAIDDEVGAYEGTTIHIDKSGILYAPNHECDMDECPYLKQAIESSRSIEATWHDEGGPCWTFETDIPHETFDIYEDGELFCVGIVFTLGDIQTKPPNDPLTLEQLREMDGDKIYVHYIDGLYTDEDGAYFGKFEQLVRECNGKLTACELPLEYYGKTWLAYCRKPEEGI